jgi:hypothetical protein
MNTYKINADWNEFRQFVISELKSVDKDSIGFMYKGNDIYIRSLDDYSLKLIMAKYESVVSDTTPAVIFDRGWGYFGNKNLF